LTGGDDMSETAASLNVVRHRIQQGLTTPIPNSTRRAFDGLLVADRLACEQSRMGRTDHRDQLSQPLVVSGPVGRLRSEEVPHARRLRQLAPLFGVSPATVRSDALWSAGSGQGVTVLGDGAWFNTCIARWRPPQPLYGPPTAPVSNP
jgi:hypothetical protein